MSEVPKGRRWIAPSTVLPAVAILVLALLIFLPRDSTSGGQLTTYHATAQGARALYDVLAKLGYPLSRRVTPLNDSVSSHAIYVVLAPPVPFSTTERHQLLTAVRHGAGLIFVAADDQLTDSLGFDLDPSYVGGGGFLSQTIVAGGTTNPREISDIFNMYPIAATVTLSDSLEDSVARTVLMWLPPRFAPSSTDSIHARTLVLGRSFGQGRVVAIANADLLSNQILRDGRPAAAVVRALEWIGPSRGPVVFDEYHQGFGAHASMSHAIATALMDTVAGRATLQAIAAALILIAAVGARPLAPVEQTSITRRSPLEHVGALAHAYTQVDAPHLGTDRLVRGLRRRHPLGVARSVSHEQYLGILRTSVPSSAADIDLVRTALSSTTRSFAGVATAVARIEATFGPTPSLAPAPDSHG